MNTVNIYTDGACSGNPGPGGYGIILKSGAYEKELYCGFNKTTNNRMELMSVVHALSILKDSCIVNLYSDSQYVCNAISRKWVDNWQRNKWKNSQKQPVKNKDLWELLIPLLKKHEVRCFWIKGHDGHTENERCDELAREAIKMDNKLDDNNYTG